MQTTPSSLNPARHTSNSGYVKPVAVAHRLEHIVSAGNRSAADLLGTPGTQF